MRKKELLAGQYNVYAIYDKISKHYIKLYFASTDEEFIKKYLPDAILYVALRDLQCFKIGILNDVTGELKPTIRKRIQTDCYCFPHHRCSPVGENLSLEEIESAVNETKNALLAQNSADESTEENKTEE